jgi:hypothetical protein
VLGYRLDDQGFRSWQGLGISLFATASTPAVTGCRLDNWVLSPGRSWNFSLHHCIHTSSQALFTGYGRLSLEVKWLVHLVSRLRMYEAVPPLPLGLHGVLLKLKIIFTYFYLHLHTYIYIDMYIHIYIHTHRSRVAQWYTAGLGAG